jgi:hypothetical protein
LRRCANCDLGKRTIVNIFRCLDRWKSYIDTVEDEVIVKGCVDGV